MASVLGHKRKVYPNVRPGLMRLLTYALDPLNHHSHQWIRPLLTHLSMECPPIYSTDLDDLRLLGTFGEVGSMSTSMWEIEKLPHRNDAVFPPLLWTGKWCKTPKPPCFTKYGQEPSLCCKIWVPSLRHGA
jgi:hypothetical protein